MGRQYTSFNNTSNDIMLCGPRDSGVHIRQNTRVNVTIINCNMQSIHFINFDGSLWFSTNTLKVHTYNGRIINLVLSYYSPLLYEHTLCICTCSLKLHATNFLQIS